MGRIEVVQSSSEEGGGEHRRTLEDEGEEEEEEPQHERENLRKKEEINHITPHMMEMAQHTNGADMELYEFVTAKFCDRLRDIGLLETAVVQNELSRRDQLEERCVRALSAYNTYSTTDLKPVRLIAYATFSALLRFFNTRRDCTMSNDIN